MPSSLCRYGNEYASPSMHVPSEMFKAEVVMVILSAAVVFIKILTFLTVEPLKLFTLVAPLLIAEIFITKALIPSCL